MSFRYRALGLDITSPFPCGGFWACDTATTGRDITFELGIVPKTLDDLIYDQPLVQVSRSGTCLHHVPGIARYLIRERRVVTIDVLPHATLERALSFLRGAPLALLCHQWGLVPLSVAGMVVNGRAVLLSGGAACGKSTLALALALRGHRVLGDGLGAFDNTNPTQPVIWPSFPTFRLWPDTLQALAPTEPSLPPGPSGALTLDAHRWFHPRPVAPAAILTLSPARGGLALACPRLLGLKAFEATMNAVTIADLAAQPFHGQTRLTPAARLAEISVVYDLWHPVGLSHVDQQADRVLAVVAQGL